MPEGSGAGNRKIITSAAAPQQGGAGLAACVARNEPRSVDGLRLWRGELAKLEFAVVVEKPVFEQIELATAVQQLAGRLRQRCGAPQGGERGALGFVVAVGAIYG